jgi:hypothetical protein
MFPVGGIATRGIPTTPPSRDADTYSMFRAGSTVVRKSGEYVKIFHIFQSVALQQCSTIDTLAVPVSLVSHRLGCPNQSLYFVVQRD